MSANLAELDYLRGLAERLSEARHGSKRTVVETAANFLGCSVNDVYRKLKRVGCASERKPRSDRGTTSVPEDVARKAAGMVRMAQRANGKQTLTIKDSLSILQANGYGAVDTSTGEVTPVDVSPTTLARAMRVYDCHPKQLAVPSAHTVQRSLHPNHVWQIDASVCVIFYLPRGGMQIMEEKEFYKNKPKNLARVERDRVIRYVITDHTSGNFYLEYVLGAETAENLIQVFLNAIQYRGTDDPFHGVPLILMMDMGAANTSGLFRNLLKRLKVMDIAHLPGNPRANGQVEKHQDIIERSFEGRLAFQRVDSLEQLNTQATGWRKYFCGSAVHSRHGRTRNAVWMTIREDQLRLAPAPELCRDLVTTHPVEATVRGDLTVAQSLKRFGRNRYDLRFIPGVMPKQKVQVVVNPYRAPAIDVVVTDGKGQESLYTVEPMAQDDHHFPLSAPVIGERFRAMPESDSDHSRTLINRDAYGVDTEREVDAARKARTPAFEGQFNVMADVEQAPLPDYLPRRGRDLGLDSRHRELVPLNHVDAAKQLKAALGDAWTREHFGWLQQRYPDGVPVDAIAQIASELSKPTRIVAPLRVVKAGGESC
ncbi:hypothetical protein [Lysobacter sp. CA196]|uniref:hypothetical protein n=1 Tax=Lysobacter sp. CA196 TaxID=3455606 RepID=UPI003F8D6ECD